MEMTIEGTTFRGTPEEMMDIIHRFNLMVDSEEFKQLEFRKIRLKTQLEIQELRKQIISESEEE